MLERILPFVTWMKGYDGVRARADLIAGITVALVLIPQSMAYAQLAGLSPYYGLYAAFLPPMFAALFGSSRQLATGPVAVVSLMTLSVLETLAQPGSETFVAQAILLALLIGLFQLALGILRLGVVVNFLSHPVVNGFTNAAALIIASSQLAKIFGVYVGSSQYHYETILSVIDAALHYTHWPTFALAVLAFAVMIALKHVNPRIPNVLAAVVLTTLISWFVGFEKNRSVSLSGIRSREAGITILRLNASISELKEARTALGASIAAVAEAEKKHGRHSAQAVQARHEASMQGIQIQDHDSECRRLRSRLRRFLFTAVENSNGEVAFYAKEEAPRANAEGGTWRIKVGGEPIDEEAVQLMGGGAVVGDIPRGLPSISTPRIDLGWATQLLPVAIVISLLGFMEAISIAKAIAAKTGQRLDSNQELIGQGLANVVGSFSQGYPVSGSFSRSAVNIQAGALTGMSSVFTSTTIAVVLLFFTPLLYHLPQSVLAAIIMMAVVGLINVTGVIRAWRARRYDGIVAVVSFVGTLAFAPHLERGIMIGMALSLGIALFRHMRPDIAIAAKHPDGSFRNSERWGLRQCRYIAAIRFNGSLFFANSSYLEDRILDRVSSMPDLRHVLIVGNGINDLDSSAVETVSSLIDKLRNAGYEVSFSGLNDAIIDVMKRTHLYEKIGHDHMFRNVQNALQAFHAKAHANSQETACPLLTVCYKE